jgi:DNA-binding FadR family transcriptional regulator
MAPGADAVTETAAIYLARHGMQVAELAELRTRVEVALADLAARRIDAEGTALLRHALRREGNATGAERVESVHDLHVAVAASAHNGVLELVALVLIRLSAVHQSEGLAARRLRNSAEVLRTHEGIAAAIESGDQELGRRRMRRHLQALGALMG